jgi:CDGSH-type Zn-finger protein
MTASTPPSRARVDVVVCPDGPLLVRGDVTLRGTDGNEIPRHRSTVALCRCGATGIAPWCDGSHKLAARRAR